MVPYAREGGKRSAQDGKIKGAIRSTPTTISLRREP